MTATVTAPLSPVPRPQGGPGVVAPVNDPDALGREVARLQGLVAARGFAQSEACFLRNWLDSAGALLRAGGAGAARYQITAVSRRLARRTSSLRDTWDGPTTPRA